MFTLAVFIVLSVLYSLVETVGDAASSGFVETHQDAWPIYATTFVIDFLSAVYTIFIRPEYVEKPTTYESGSADPLPSFMRDDAQVHYVETERQLKELTAAVEALRTEVRESGRIAAGESGQTS